MSSTLWAMMALATVGQVPVVPTSFGSHCPTCNQGGGGGYGSVSAAYGGYDTGYVSGGGMYSSGGSLGAPQYGHEELYNFDHYDNWVHGYFQEIPHYHGYGAFRPYNWKHALSQSQISGGWGMPHNQPYNNGFYRKFERYPAPQTEETLAPNYESAPIMRRPPASVTEQPSLLRSSSYRAPISTPMTHSVERMPSQPPTRRATGTYSAIFDDDVVVPAPAYGQAPTVSNEVPSFSTFRGTTGPGFRPQGR